MRMERAGQSEPSRIGIRSVHDIGFIGRKFQNMASVIVGVGGKMVGRFLAGIGAVVWAPDLARYLLLRRASDKDFAPGIWECVTGRVDQGEGFSEALLREIGEELGVLGKATLAVDFVIGTTHFHRGVPRPENELLGVIYHCSLSTPEAVRLSVEHTEMRWVTLVEARDLLRSEQPSEAWLLKVLARADALRRHLPSQVVALQRQGMEMG